MGSVGDDADVGVCTRDRGRGYGALVCVCGATSRKISRRLQS